jgi:hypothetical protein
MIAGVGQDEWEPLLPNVDKIWVTQRLYKGYTGTSDTVKLDGNGKLVGGDDSPAEPVTGAVWSTPILMSGKDGVNGLNGNDGNDGATGLAPEHEWNDTELRFRNPDTSWGPYTDLKGDSVQVQVGGSTWTQPESPRDGDVWIDRV